MTKSRILATGVSVFLLLFLLTGCAKTPKPTPPENPAAIHIRNGKTDQVFIVTDAELVKQAVKTLYQNSFRKGRYIDPVDQLNGYIYLAGFFDEAGNELSETFSILPQNYLMVDDYLYQMPTDNIIRCLADVEEHETGVDPIKTGGIVDPNAPIMQPWP